MDEFEVTCIVKDENGTISHCGVKGYGIQDISTIEKLLEKETCSFIDYDGGIKKKIYLRESSDETIFLTSDAHDSDTNELNYLPICDRSFIKQLIESVR